MDNDSINKTFHDLSGNCLENLDRLIQLTVLLSINAWKPGSLITLPARHHLWLDEEADPAGHHEHEAGQINLTFKWR